MGPRPKPKRLIVRSFEAKPSGYRDKPKPAPMSPAAPSSSAPPVKPPKIRPPGPAADRKPPEPVEGPLAKQLKRKRARLAALAWLRETWPDLFGYPPKPLAIGAGKDMTTQALAVGLKRDAIGAALHFHVNSHGYLGALAAPGAQRHGLDGVAVAAVTVEHQAEAAKLMAAIDDARAKRAQAPAP